MTKEKTTKAILFADVSKSTALYEELGDRKAQQIISAVVKLLTKATIQHQGTVVKTIGDEVMSVFDNAPQAMNAALLMQRLLQQLSAKLFFELRRALNIQIGIHLGPVIYEKEDYFGDTVNLAARVVGLAKERQILTTRQVVAQLSDQQRTQLRKIDCTKVKGKREEIEIFEVIWEESNVTIMISNPAEELAAAGEEGALTLNFADQTIALDPNRPSATIGRHPDNDIVINDDLVSRLHARIELRRGQFVLADQSINGTYVLTKTKGAAQNFLRRDECILQGQGIISVGRSIKKETPNTISFCCGSPGPEPIEKILLEKSNIFKKIISFKWLRRA